MNQRNKRIISYFILFSLIIILGVVYAILQANLQINGTAKIAENRWNVHFENIVVNQDSVNIGTGDTAATIDPQNNCKVDFSVTLSLPGDFYEFTVDAKNDGTIDAMIGTLTKSLKVNNVETETVPEYLIYTVTYDDGGEILENQLLAKSTKETYKIRLEFKTDIDAEDLPEATTLSMSFEPTYVQANENAIKPLSFYEIMKNNAVIDTINSTYVSNATPGIKWDEIASDTNGKGIYIRSGTENDTNPIYYFRGAVDNNNVYFGGFCWKIVRTTETGGIKMIYNGVPTSGSCGSGTTSQSNSSIGNSRFNLGRSDGVKHIGYIYDNSGVETDSTIKSYIDNWYTGTGTFSSLAGNSLSNYESYLEDTIFCNDKSTHAYSEFTSEEQSAFYFQSTTTIYGPTYRLAKKTGPSVTCPNNSDAYTKSNTLGNGKLANPVGLLTSDEIWLAGEGTYNYGNSGTGYKNQTYYLQNNSSWWSLSPCSLSGSSAEMWRVESSGGIQFIAFTDRAYGVRPVVSLKPGTVFSGDGTGENPYTVE